MKSRKRFFQYLFVVFWLSVAVPSSYASSIATNLPNIGGFPQGYGSQTGSRVANTQDKANNSGEKKASSNTKQTTTQKTTTKYKVSSQRIAKIKSCINSYTVSDLNDNLVVQKIKDEIAKTVPLVPSKPLKKIDTKSLNEEARKMVEKEFGASNDRVKRFEEEAKTKYPLYQVGDSISLNYNAGSRRYSVKGKLIRITQKSITIDDKVVNLMDLGEDDLAKFDAKKNQSLRSQYIRNRTSAENNMRLSAEQDNVKRLQADCDQENEKSGYIYDSQKATWCTAQEYIVMYINEVKERGEEIKDNPKAAENKTITNDNRTTENKNAGRNTTANKDGKKQKTVISVDDFLNVDVAISSKLDGSIDFDSLYDVWYSIDHRGIGLRGEETLKDELNDIYEDACRYSLFFDPAYAVWKEKNKQKSFENFYREFFSSIIKGISADDIVKDFTGLKSNYEIGEYAPRSMFYLEPIENNYGYFIGLDYVLYDSLKAYIEEGGSNQSNKRKKAFILLRAQPRLLVVDEKELQRNSSVPDEIKEEILRIRQSIQYQDRKLFLSIVAPHMKEAKSLTHFNLYQKNRKEALEALLNGINSKRTKTIAKKYINDSLENIILSYSYTIDSREGRTAYQNAISTLKKHPDYLTVSTEQLCNINSITDEVKKEILNIRQGTGSQVKIYWLIILQSQYDND